MLASNSQLLVADVDDVAADEVDTLNLTINVLSKASAQGLCQTQSSPARDASARIADTNYQDWITDRDPSAARTERSAMISTLPEAKMLLPAMLCSFLASHRLRLLYQPVSKGFHAYLVGTLASIDYEIGKG